MSADPLHLPRDCRAPAQVLNLVGDKWSLRVVMLLGDGACRFNALRRRIPGVSPQVLSRTLRGLERDGMLTRTVAPTVPPQVDYALTPLGRSLWDALAPVGRWAQEHEDAIEAARRRFDDAHEAPRAAARPAAAGPARG
jgi:DNA-binding HxlR family transcriptional regulator